MDTEKELFEQLQAEIIEDARKYYSEKVIERWLSPRNIGKIKNPQRFKGKIPYPPSLPDAVWINKPSTDVLRL